MLLIVNAPGAVMLALGFAVAMAVRAAAGVESSPLLNVTAGVTAGAADLAYRPGGGGSFFLVPVYAIGLGWAVAVTVLWALGR